MIVDSSALLAIILDEPDAYRFARAIADSIDPCLPAPNWLEVAMVTDGRADDALRARFDTYADRWHITIAEFRSEYATAARLAWQRFGRGRHAAKLNFGDCMAYGFARVEGRPLLFKGGDFPLTDIEPALKD